MEALHYGAKDCGGELARAYVPFQKLGALYGPEEALCHGTVFPELFRPYHGRAGADKCPCRVCQGTGDAWEMGPLAGM